MLTVEYTSTGTKDSPSYTCHLVFDEGGCYASYERQLKEPKEGAKPKRSRKAQATPATPTTPPPPPQLRQLASIRQIEADTEYGPVRCWEADVSMNSTIPDSIIRDRTLTRLKAKIERALFERIGGAAPQEPQP